MQVNLDFADPRNGTVSQQVVELPGVPRVGQYISVDVGKSEEWKVVGVSWDLHGTDGPAVNVVCHPDVLDEELAEEPGTHFWFMTIQTPNGAGVFVNSYQGTWTPKLGQTRLTVFNAIRAFIREKDPRTAAGVVVAFDLQRNEL